MNTCRICMMPNERYGCRELHPGIFCNAPPSRALRFPIPDEVRVEPCGSCPTPLVWMQTRSGRAIALEAVGARRGAVHSAHHPFLAKCGGGAR